MWYSAIKHDRAYRSPVGPAHKPFSQTSPDQLCNVLPTTLTLSCWACNTHGNKPLQHRRAAATQRVGTVAWRQDQCEHVPMFIPCSGMIGSSPPSRHPRVGVEAERHTLCVGARCPCSCPPWLPAPHIWHTKHTTSETHCLAGLRLAWLRDQDPTAPTKCSQAASNAAVRARAEVAQTTWAVCMPQHQALTSRLQIVLMVWRKEPDTELEAGLMARMWPKQSCILCCTTWAANSSAVMASPVLQLPCADKA